jgi:amino acid transporter
LIEFYLASLVGTPKILQAVCRDMIFPRLKYFAVGNGKSDQPIRAYFLTYFVAVSFTAIGKEIFFRDFFP